MESGLPELEEHKSISFAEYGVDDYGKRATHQPLDTDPHVLIEPLEVTVAREIVTWLRDPNFLADMQLVAGSVEPRTPDNWIRRYLRVRSALESLLQEHFPMLVDR